MSQYTFIYFFFFQINHISLDNYSCTTALIANVYNVVMISPQVERIPGPGGPSLSYLQRVLLFARTRPSLSAGCRAAWRALVVAPPVTGTMHLTGN